MNISSISEYRQPILVMQMWLEIWRIIPKKSSIPEWGYLALSQPGVDGADKNMIRENLENYTL